MTTWIVGCTDVLLEQSGGKKDWGGKGGVILPPPPSGYIFQINIFLKPSLDCTFTSHSFPLCFQMQRD